MMHRSSRHEPPREIAVAGVSVGRKALEPARAPTEPPGASWAEQSSFLAMGAAIVGLVFLGWLLFGWRVSYRGIWSAHEGRAAQNAQSILDTGNWLTPTLFSQEVENQKPPLYYWMVATVSGIQHSRVSPWAVRAPATLSAIAGLTLVFLFGRRLWNWETGIWAAVILATTTRYAWLARVGRIDMPLTIICMATMYTFWKRWSDAQLKPGKPISWSLYVLVAIGVMLKGPVAIVLVALPLALFLWLTGEPIVPFVQAGWQATWKRCRIVPGVLLTLAITAPWFIYAIYESGGAFFWDFFFHHNLERAIGSDETLKSGPIWFYIPRILVDCFPWSVLFPAVMIALWQNRERLFSKNDPHAPAYLFLMSWIGSLFVFLSLVSFKRSDYLLPVMPAVALLLAGWLHDRFERFERRVATGPAKNPRRRARLIFVSAIVIVAVSAPLLIWATIEFLKKGVVETVFEIEVVDHYMNITDRFMLDHVERLLRENWPLLGIGMTVITGCLWLFHTGWHNRRNRRILAGLALPWAVCFLFQVHLFLPALDPLREMSRFGETIRILATPERPIYYFGKFDADLVFHAGKPARLIGDWEEFVRLGDSSEPAFVVMKASQLKWVEDDPRMARWVPIADNRETAIGEHRDPRVLLTNQPASMATNPGGGKRGTDSL